jgi:hypothetical protein
MNPSNQQPRSDVDESEENEVTKQLNAGALRKVIYQQNQKEHRKGNPDDARDHH